MGYLFALTSAFLWALVTIFYKDVGSKVSPVGMNIGKNIVAVACIGVLLLSTGFDMVKSQTLFFLIMSGILGISLGDTFFFMALSRLKTSMAVLMTTAIPVLTMLFAVVFLNEHLSIRSWTGCILVITGIAIALSARGLEDTKGVISVSGILYSLLAAVSCAASVIFSKYALMSIPALEASFIRHLSGLAVLIIWGSITTRLGLWLKPITRDVKLMHKLFAASFLGTFLGTWLCLLGLQFTTASAATVLNSTSPLFIIPLSGILLKEKIQKRSIIGAMIAFIGVCIIIAGG